jgi:hypothetical protein
MQGIEDDGSQWRFGAAATDFARYGDRRLLLVLDRQGQTSIAKALSTLEFSAG